MMLFFSDNYPVRFVNTTINQIGIDSIETICKGGVTSSDHPRGLLKFLAYAHLCNLYSSRKIEQAFGENVHFM
jgi:transposase